MLDALYWLTYEASSWAAKMTMTLGWSLRVKGRENLPKTGPVLMLANHQSFMDPGAIGSLYNRHAAYLARKPLFDNPLWGFYLRVLNSVPIDQEGVAKEGLKAILAKLEAGWPVMMFPEGARTYDGRLQPFKPGVLLLVKRVKCPILPIGIAGAYAAWSRFMKVPIPSPLFLPPTERCVGISFGRPRDPNSLTGLSREDVLKTLESDIAAQVAEADKIRRR